jgi:hypothetical protein
MPENKTQPTEASVDAFIDAVADETRRTDARTLAALMTRLTGEAPRMWGPSIIGFGSYRYQYASGHGGEMCRIGFSPRKTELVLYALNGSPEQDAQLARLGKHRIGKGCLYIRKLVDVDMGVLEELIRDQFASMEARYPGN